MNVMKFFKHGTHMAVIKTKETLVQNEQEFLDFMAQAMDEADADIIIVEKAAFPDEFFDLKSGLAGTVHQKLANYRCRMAIVGNFDNYESKSLSDYIRESNTGGTLVFKQSISEAITYFSK